MFDYVGCYVLEVGIGNLFCFEYISSVKDSCMFGFRDVVEYFFFVFVLVEFFLNVGSIVVDFFFVGIGVMVYSRKFIMFGMGEIVKVEDGFFFCFEFLFEFLVFEVVLVVVFCSLVLFVFYIVYDVCIDCVFVVFIGIVMLGKFIYCLFDIVD